MAEGSVGGNLPKWRCIYCPAEFLGISPGSFNFCPKCSKAQKEEHASDIPVISRVNPECGETLSSDKATVCEVPQQIKSATTIPGPSKSVEEHKLKIAQAVEKQTDHLPEKPLAPIEKTGNQLAQLKDGSPDVPGCQPANKAKKNQVPPKNTNASTPNSSPLDSGASTGMGEKASTSSPIPHSSPDEQNPHVEQMTIAASSDTTSTVDQKSQDIKKAKPENDTKEGTQGLSWSTSWLCVCPCAPGRFLCLAEGS